MTSRIRHLLLIALFAAAHLVVQPYVSTLRCQGMANGGDTCCCKVEPGPSKSSGCCSHEPEPGSQEEDASHSGCHCVASHPVAPSKHASNEELARVDGINARWVPGNRLFWRERPAMTTRAARASAPPPRVARRTAQVCTQAFRL